jgi:transposase-like protein
MRLYREVLYVKSGTASIEAMKQSPWDGMALVEKP